MRGVEPLRCGLVKLLARLHDLRTHAHKLCGHLLGARDEGSNRRDGVDRDGKQRHRQQDGIDHLACRHELRHGLVGGKRPGICHVLHVARTRARPIRMQADGQQREHKKQGHGNPHRGKSPFPAHERPGRGCGGRGHVGSDGGRGRSGYGGRGHGISPLAPHAHFPTHSAAPPSACAAHAGTTCDSTRVS